jgi:hypothetical protein
VFALPPGSGRRTFRCLDYDEPDPMRSEIAKRWLQGELGQPWYTNRQAAIECSSCSTLYTTILGDRAPTWPLKCVECDAPLPPKARGRFVCDFSVLIN